MPKTPRNNFLPDIGRLATYVRPQGPGIRVDDGFEQGMDIPIYYDPMIAKLIAYGKDRTEAIGRMKRAIDEYQITGPETTLAFCRFVMGHEAFVSGRFDTNFIPKYFHPELLQPPARTPGRPWRRPWPCNCWKKPGRKLRRCKRRPPRADGKKPPVGVRGETRASVVEPARPGYPADLQVTGQNHP
jgi:hypothetical protein